MPSHRPLRASESPQIPASRPQPKHNKQEEVDDETSNSTPIVPISRPGKLNTLDAPVVPSSRPKINRREVMDDLDIVELELKREMEDEERQKYGEHKITKEGNDEDDDTEVPVIETEAETEGKAEESREFIEEDSIDNTNDQSDFECEVEEEYETKISELETEIETEGKVEEPEEFIEEDSIDNEKGQPNPKSEEEEAEEEEEINLPEGSIIEPIIGPIIGPKLEMKEAKAETEKLEQIMDIPESIESSTNEESEPSSETYLSKTIEKPIDSTSSTSTEMDDFQQAPTSTMVTELEEPTVPKSRPTISRKPIEGSDETIVKKLPPRVPKKPSSKIAAFQHMIEQQQQQDMGNLLRGKGPQIPMKRPSIKTSVSTESEPEAIESKSGPPSRVNSKFSQNLNGLFAGGVPLPGMAMGTDQLSALKAQRITTNDEADGTSIGGEKVNDVRRGRGRGPKGRKLPTNVKEIVEVNDQTLGNNSRGIAVQNLWTFSFKADEKVEEKSEKPEDPDVFTIEDNNETNENKVPDIDEGDKYELDDRDIEEFDANDVPPVETAIDDALTDSESSTEPELLPADDMAPGFESLTSMATNSEDSIISTTTENEPLGDSGDASVLSESESSSI